MVNLNMLRKIKKILVGNLQSCPQFTETELELGVFTCYTKQNDNFEVYYYTKNQEDKEFCQKIGFFTSCRLCPWNDDSECRWIEEVIDSSELVKQLKNALKRGNSIIFVFEDNSITWLYPKLPCHHCNQKLNCFIYNNSI